jgi:hypothetical protein
MSEDKQIIDDIFRQKMSDYEPSEELAEDNWNAIYKKKNQRMFYIFRVNHLNIYYVVGMAIGLSFLISFLFSTSETATVTSDEHGTTLLFDSLHTTTNKSESHNSIEKEVVSREKTKTVNNKSSKVEEIKEGVSLMKAELENSNSNKNLESIEQSTLTLPQDSNVGNTHVIAKPEINATTPVPPKVVYMYKRDTVFTYDTVSVKKKKPRKTK